MDTHAETSTRIDFSRGHDITPTVVLDGEEIESQTFNVKTHQIEELLNFIAHHENDGCDIYL